MSRRTRAAAPATRLDAERHVPLKPLDLQVLLLLSAGGRHGYGIMKGVEEQSEGAVRLEVGSLYRLIGRLERDRLIASQPSGDENDDPRRGRVYALTALGREAARAECERLERVVALARESRLLGAARRP
ncbi:MAG TPA: helix-turn-helix transcriptional regulator [Thermoanaerobaculia bacterium]|nr:helix-turn-helix transcriptional regulator [Thermoanaerobaculia bacterium]